MHIFIMLSNNLLYYKIINKFKNMTDIFNGTLTREMDWGAVSVDGQTLPASGQAVQTYIKDEFSSFDTKLDTKPGYFFSHDDQDKNQNILLGFIDEEHYNSWVAAGSKLDDTLYIISRTTLNKAKPQAYNTVILENKMGSSVVVSTDNTVKLQVKFISTHYEPSGNDLIPSPTGEQGTLIVQRRTDSNSSWETRYETLIQSVESNAAPTTIDLTDYLSNGTQEVQLQVTGNDTKLSTTWLRFTVTKTNLGIEFATAWQDPQVTNYMELSYYINGAIGKTLNLKITGPGGNGERTYSESLGTRVWSSGSGTPKNVKIYDSSNYNYKVVTEGVHTIESWITVDGTNIESEHLISQVLMIPSPTTKSYIVINELNTSLINWTNQTLFKYALYNPSNSTMPVSFILGDYNTDDIYLKYEVDAAATNTITSLTNVIELESDESNIVSKMDITSDGVALCSPIEFNINNTGSYSPTEGADFIFNPRSRNNDENNPKTIFNSVTGKEIPSTWNGFNFSNDGWVTDNNKNRCLRILAGQTVEIDYNPFADWGTNKSCTIEMTIASRNISHEDAPLLSMARFKNDTFEGWAMWPTKGIFKTEQQQTEVTQDVLFQEGVPTHIAVNIIHNMYSYNDGESDHPINLVRIFINGVINREFAYEEDTLGDITGTTTSDNWRKIILGNINAGADLDVYNIRVYKSKLSSTNVLQDYISSLPTSAEKDIVLTKNAILGDSGTISYELVKNKYNTILWKYSENEQKAFEDPSDTSVTTAPITRMVGVAEADHSDTKDSRQYGDLVIRIIKEDGTVDKDRSGTLNDMSAQGQGTSSMGYWKWNQRWVFQKEGEDKDKDGINSKYTTKFTAEDPNSPNNGKKAWQPFEGAPFAKKLDAKINWASPMQSHKIGSTGMYNDMWKIVVKSNEIMDLGTAEDGVNFTGTPNGYADCRVTVGQVPFLVFCQKSKEEEPEFYGLYTMGPSKGDKPTFGYNDDSDLFKNFSMIEGCDNGTPLVMCRVPWNDHDVQLDKDGEIWLYGGKEQYELSMGETGAEYVANSPTIKSFKEWNRFVYSLNPNIEPFVGSYSELITTDKALNNEKFYWTTKADSEQGLSSYNLYRWDSLKKKWVNAGLDYINDDPTTEEYEIVNLKEQTGINPTGTYESQNQAFINKRAEMFRNGIGKWFAEDDFQFTMMFLKLIAASDNWAKNTYIYNAGFTDSEGNLTSKWRFFQDDLDTIFSLDNSGYKVKPYYVEEHDKKESDASDYFNSNTNALYCLAELAWPDELRSMMRSILNAATSLGGSVMGCFDKYYNKIPNYFPQVAYNEIAKLLYENGYINQKIGNYQSTTNPLAQAVGDQLEAEREWQRLRSIYMASFASHGEFSAADGVTSTGALNFRSSQIVGTDGIARNAPYEFKFKPHMWLYPSMSVGGSSLNPIDQTDATGKTRYNLPPRVKAGDEVIFKLDAGEVDGNTQMYIRGINYYDEIGDFGNIALNPAYTFNLSGERLIKFEATDLNCTNGMAFRPNTMGIPTSGMNNIKKFIIKGDVMADTPIVTGGLNLSGLWRLEEVDLRATSITGVTLPNNSNIESLYLPTTLTTLNLNNQPKLKNFSIASINNIERLSIANCPELNSYDIFKKFYDAKINLTEISLLGIDWTDVTIDQLNYILNIQTCNVTGKIVLKDAEQLDFNTKMNLLNKFGNIDDESNDLYIDYDHTDIDIANGKVIGESYITVNGDYQFSVSVAGNNFVDYEWVVDPTDYAKINPKSGVLTYTDNDKGAERKAIITCRVYARDIDDSLKWFENIKKEIYFEPRIAQIGDYVYSDGSISSPYDYNMNKKVIGICYYINPLDPTDRRMVALSNIIEKTGWGLDSTMGYTSGEGNVKKRDYKINSQSNITESRNGITDINSIGTGGYRVNISDLVDDTQSDGFKVYPTNTALGDIGLATLTYPLTQERSEYNTNDIIPIGLKKTLEIIEHRNRYIINSGDFNLSGTSFRIPGKTLGGEYPDSINEMEDLTNLINNVVNVHGDIAKNYYYPAASYCYAYTPDVEDKYIKDAKFEKHKWYLPTFGELARIYYCEQNSIFADAMNVNKHNIYTKLSTNTWSSTEYNDNQTWACALSTGYIFTTGSNKTSNFAVRPVTRF